jgi:hypothetical protein
MVQKKYMPCTNCTGLGKYTRLKPNQPIIHPENAIQKKGNEKGREGKKV